MKDEKFLFKIKYQDKHEYIIYENGDSKGFPAGGTTINNIPIVTYKMALLLLPDIVKYLCEKLINNLKKDHSVQEHKIGK